MAKERIVNTRFWNDSFVSELDPLGKLLFIYFITNEHTNISGIYELPLKIAAVETGIDQTMFVKMMPVLEPKIIYKDGWVIIPNFQKHQHYESGNVHKGIQRELTLIPGHILDIWKGYTRGIQGVSYTKLNLTKPIGNDLEVSDETSFPKKVERKSGITTSSVSQLTEDDVKVVETDEDGNEIKKSKWGRAPSTLPLAQNWPIQRVWYHFRDKCHVALGTRPTGASSVYSMIRRAFEIHKLSEEEIYDVFDDWFAQGKPDDQTIQIRQALSDFNINSWRTRK